MTELYIVLAILVVVSGLGYFLGRRSQKSKQDKKNVKELIKDAEIDNLPDIDNPGDEL